MSARILVVEDEPAVNELIVINLSHAGFEVVTTDDAETAWNMLSGTPPDVVLLDWMLPGISGFQLIRHMRADSRWRDVPVIMLTARTDEVDKISALEAGADDYITKPFSPREMVARVKAVLRRRDPQMLEGSVELGGLRLVPHARKALAGDALISLGPTEFRLLHFLMTHAERVHSRGQLLDYVWGGRSHIEERTVDVHIRRLRSILEDHSMDAMVQTVRGMGYRFSTRLDGA
ncbi:MAG: phosphate regulon transcriptional regulator PhoB [Azonexus sp.]|nr:phosphate regulon transcriptional regulator PhoB [Azonexus sp.]